MLRLMLLLFTLWFDTLTCQPVLTVFALWPSHTLMDAILNLSLARTLQSDEKWKIPFLYYSCIKHTELIRQWHSPFSRSSVIICVVSSQCLSQPNYKHTNNTGFLREHSQLTSTRQGFCLVKLRTVTNHNQLLLFQTVRDIITDSGWFQQVFSLLSWCNYIVIYLHIWLF